MADDLKPGPARVISVFICLGVRFCASSMMTNLLRKVRPRTKFRLLILILLRTRSLVAARPHRRPAVAARQHLEVVVQRAHPWPIFSFLVAGEADVPPTGTVTRVTMISV